ncbi:MAG TPA: hypothetical protein VNN74_03575 [Candidatus Micrarchaeia archaeon]|nr:hypothetical protein [Candidatus Micrarchaeia archaeon]
MSALLTLLALVAGLVLYPGGLTLLAVALSALGATALPRSHRVGAARGTARGRRRGRWSGLAEVAPARLTGVGIVLAGLAVVALPWPANPLTAIPGASAIALGSLGVPVTVAALWAADGLDQAPARSTWLLVHGAWAAALVGLLLAAGSATWSSVLALPGAAPEAARVAIGVAAAVALPRLVPGGTGGGALGSVSWAAHAAVISALWVPRAAHLDPIAAVGVWAAMASGLALAHRAAPRLWSGPLPGRRGGRPGSDRPEC